MNILNSIVQTKKDVVKESKLRLPISDIKARIKDIPGARAFASSIKRQASGPIKFIAEIKKASPSNGVIREDFNPEEIARVYAEKGAAAISVLTEERYFHGRLDYINQVKTVAAVPVLRKDFIFDDYQIYESRAFGADAILLITAILTKNQITDFLGIAGGLSLDCLVEVHHWKELDTALYAGARIIGINNRDLNTMTVDLNTTFELLKDIPHNLIVVSESGIKTRADVERLEKSRADAMLVGTSLMQAEDIGARLDELLGRKN